MTKFSGNAIICAEKLSEVIICVNYALWLATLACIDVSEGDLYKLGEELDKKGGQWDRIQNGLT